MAILLADFLACTETGPSTAAEAAPKAGPVAATPAKDAEVHAYPPEVAALCKQLSTLLTEKKRDQAKLLLSQYSKKNHCGEDFYLAAGEVYIGHNLYKQGAQIAADGLKSFPKSFALHYMCAHVWLTVCEPQLAEPELRACLSILPKSPTAHAELGKVLNEREDYAGALIELDKAIAAGPGPTDADTWATKGLVLRNLGRAEESVKALDQAIKIVSGGQDYDMRKTRGDQLMKLHRYAQAIQDYLIMVKQDPLHDYQPLNHLGQCYLALQKPREALKYFDLTVKNKEDYIPAHRGRLEALEALKQTREAAQEKQYLHEMEQDFTPMK
jgi:tetratricopeptide (TPR) repeat protein